MTSSSKVIKAHRQLEGRLRVSVDATLPAPPVQLEPEMTEAFREMMERAKREARAIIEQAELEAADIRHHAEEEGRRQGYEAGRHQGLEEARTDWQALRRELQEPLTWVAQTRDYLGRLNDEATLALAAALSLSLYSRLKLERLDVIRDYLADLVSTVDGEKVALFLDGSWAPRLQALEEVLGEVIPAVTVAIDDSLATGVMRAEGVTSGTLGGPLVSLKRLIEEALG
ncbi:MAG: hypothetical protein OWU33_00190 [Firmicutes bacterium]|nr:hypothetical protein [Bacillota bacterium]